MRVINNIQTVNRKKMNSKYIGIIVALFFFTTFSQAQAPQKAKEILDQLAAKTKGFQTIQANFSFTMENLQENINEIYEGKIAIKGNKYKVSLMNVDTYYDGKDLYTYMIDAGEVNISQPDPSDEETLNPASIFTIYEQGYKYQYIGEGTAEGKPCHEIDLYPENRDKPFSRIKLLILKDEMQLYSLRQVGKDGNNYTIVVKQMKVNVPMNDNAFVFDKTAHADVDVIDMR